MKKFVFLMAACIMFSSVCWGQDVTDKDILTNILSKDKDNTQSENYSERLEQGIYVIGKDIGRKKYMLIAENQNEVACINIYDGKNSVDKPLGRKYYLANREFYSYPNIFEKEDQFGYINTFYPENVYSSLYYDYFTYSSIVNLGGHINNQNLENCYVELINCYAVPVDEAPVMDVCRNGMFRVGKDIPPGEYSVKYELTDEGDPEYSIMGSYFSVIKPASLNFNDSEQPYFSSDITKKYSVHLANGDYIVKKDVTLEGSNSSYKLKPTNKSLGDIDKKYDFSQVSARLKETALNDFNKRVSARSYFENVYSENAVTNVWFALAKNDSDKKYACMLKEMFRLYNMDMVEAGKYSKVTTTYAERREHLRDDYRQLLNIIKGAKSFSDIEFICDRIVLNRF